jgi:thiamine biosynthesis lipoprotein
MIFAPASPVFELRLDDVLDLDPDGELVWSVGAPVRGEAAPTPRIAFRAMGCLVRAQLEGDPPAAEHRLGRVPAWFETWEARLSRFRPESELSRLNARAGEAVAVSPILWAVVRESLLAAEISGGIVTPTILPALEAAGYDRSFADLDRDAFEAASPPGPAADWRSIRLESKGRRIHLPPGARLDLGGIGKGWAADRTAARLRPYGPALVEAGGDIAVSGPRRGGQAWRIAVADPRQPDEDLAQLAVASGGVATSGKDFRRWRRGGAWQHHLIDPRTGRPSSSDVLSATVVGPSLRLAETAAKTVVILGGAEGLAWIEQRPALAALVTLEDGTRLVSRRLRNYDGRS